MATSFAFPVLIRALSRVLRQTGVRVALSASLLAGGVQGLVAAQPAEGGSQDHNKPSAMNAPVPSDNHNDESKPAKQNASDEPSANASGDHFDPASAASAEAQVVNAGTEEARLTAAEWAEVVLGNDTGSLDPEHRINANLRDRGVGLVPRVLSVDEETKSARVGCGALEAVIRLPFGWHAIDDGRRTLIFDAGGRMQISINQRRFDGSTVAMGRQLLDEIIEQQPGIAAFEGDCAGIAVVGVRGLKVDSEILDQAYFIREINKSGVLLVARVTGNTDDIRLAMNLAGDIFARIELPETLAVR